jgi:hypothetical protein
MKFTDAVINGNAKLSDIHNYIAEWHSYTEPVTAYDFLGMTFEEYQKFVLDENSLVCIIDNRKKNKSK